MGYRPYVRMLMAVMLAVPVTAWGQGGGRAGRAGATPQTTTQQTAPPQAATPQAGTTGRGGRGAAAAPGAGASEFFDYDTTAGSGQSIPDGPPKETHQKATINGEALAYTAYAGYMPLRNATTGQAEAHLFYTFYAKDGAGEGRPLVFFLGGAPGVSAAWQELGGLGPKRMKWTADGTAGPPPYGWADNPYSLLSQADLVFANPVGTAFSRPGQPNRASTFWNSGADVASLGEFVRSFLNSYNRRNSPLVLAGEDLRTGRTGGLAAYLVDHRIPVHGVALFSMTLSADSVAGDTQYLTLLPSLVMAAWRHKKLAPELNAMSAEQISGQARQFASREYLHALYKGDRMTPDERTRAIANLSRLTGLSKAFIVSNDLRISLDRFSGELLRDQRRGLSYSDARVTGFVPAPAGGGRGAFGFVPPSPIDYSLSELSGGFQTAYESYLRGELGFSGNGVFYLSSGGVGEFAAPGSDDASLSAAMARNPSLHLFVGVNYYDLNAPFYATEFTLAHLNVSPEVRAHNITVSHYEAGQMPYADNKALVKLHADLSRFINEATSSAHK